MNKGYYLGRYRAIILPCLFPCGAPSLGLDKLAHKRERGDVNEMNPRKPTLDCHLLLCEIIC